jgi:hypothetical protein
VVQLKVYAQLVIRDIIVQKAQRYKSSAQVVHMQVVQEAQFALCAKRATTVQKRQ